MDSGPAPGAIEVTSQSVLSLCSINGYVTPDTPCYVYFGDDDNEANGCSTELNTFMTEKVNFCQAAPDISTMESKYAT